MTGPAPFLSRRFAGLLIGAAVALAAAAPGQGSAKAAARALKAAVKSIGVDEGSGAQAADAAAALQSFDGKVAARALLDAVGALERRVEEVSSDRRKILVRGGGSGRLKRSRYELRNLDDAREAVAAALVALRDPAALQEITAWLFGRGGVMPLWLRLRLAERLGELQQVELEWGGKRLAKADPEVLLGLTRVAAGLGSRAGAVCGAWLVGLLQHDNEDVRVGAAGALGSLAWPGGIEPMIARLDDEDGAVREALLDALVVLTGQNPGGAAASWSAWLAAEGAPFLAGERPLSRGDASAREASAGGATAAGSYFGIEQTGAGILYVFDNSLSMQAKLKRGAKGGGPTTGEGAATRWQVCKRELAAALRGLTPDKRFNLVSFANKARCFEAAMQPATPENVAAAVAWIEELKLELQTNVYDALELAFQLAGRGVGDRYYEPTADTVFFLSDGAPTIPQLKSGGMTQDDSERILGAVARWNALGRVRIHAVALGLQKRTKERNKKGRLWPYVFLKRLAEENGGRVVLKR